MSLTPESDFRPYYHQLHRVGRPGGWRSLVGIAVIALTMLLIVPALGGLVMFVVLLASGQSVGEATATLDITKEVTPAGLALINGVLAMSIPVVWLVTWVLHRLKPRWIASVAPRLRWRYLLVCVGLAIIALLSSLTVALFLPQPGGEEQFATVNEFTERTVAFLLIILLLTPLQAAGEEYVFRGYFTQAFGSLVVGVWLSRVIAVTVPALLFALAHGVQEAPVFFDRFAFGVVSGVLVLVTGGLEAGIAMHVLNNFFAFGIALAFGDMTEALNATAPSSWWMILTTLTQSMVYLGLAVWVARAMKLDNRGPSVGSVLVGPKSRV